MSRLALLLVAALLGLAGCTSSDGGNGTPDDESSRTPSSNATTEAPKGPDCAEVWQAGETLPADYSRCVADGAYGMQDVTKCDDGTRLVAFADEYFAVTGGTITKPDVAPMQDTEEYSTAFTACTGE